jgi:lantibiotic modifying enzyme
MCVHSEPRQILTRVPVGAMVIGDKLSETLERHFRSYLMSEEQRCRTRWNLGTSQCVPDAVNAVWSAVPVDDFMSDRYLAMRAEQWCCAVAELLQRLQSDWAAVGRWAGLAPHACVTSVVGPLSDLHDGGRAVYSVEIDGTPRLVYKPRPRNAERVFYKVLSWLTQNGFGTPLKSVPFLSRETYGWSDYVPWLWCETEADVETFWRRQGAFACLFYLLAATDCIADNLRVQPGDPIWVDAECICHPELLDGAQESARSPVVFNDCVLDTAMLWSDARDWPLQRVEGMAVACTRSRTRSFATGGRLLDVRRRQVLDGFADAYLFVLHHRDLWFADNGPWSWFVNVQTRVVLRSTGTYMSLMTALLCSGPRTQAVVKSSAALALASTRYGAPLPVTVVQAEIEDLRQGDVPLWYADTSSLTLSTRRERVITNCVRRSGHQVMVERGRRLGRGDLERQLWLLDAFLSLPDTCR